MSEVHELVRDAQAFRASIFHYAAAHDVWAEKEQILLLEGREIEAAGCRALGQRVLRAWLAEQDDPQPEGLT